MTERDFNLQEIFNFQTHSHKDMGGIEISPTSLLREIKNNGFHTTIDFDNGGGGMVYDGETPIAFVRSDFWRAKKGDHIMRLSDIRPLFITNAENRSLNVVGTGGEMELFVWDPKKEEVSDVMAENSPVPEWLITHGNGNGFEEEDSLFESLSPSAKNIGFSAELLNSCIELNFHHSDKPQEVALSMLRALKKLDQAVKVNGSFITPVSLFMHRPMRHEDVNQDSYVQRIAHEYMKWENVQHFLGASWQVHVEMLNIESGLKAINLYQQVSSLTYATSLSSPFGYGELNPNLNHIFLAEETNEERLNDIETYSLYDHSNWLSLRYPGRHRGSPSGGVFTSPAPEDPLEFFKLADNGLKDNDPNSNTNIPSPARAMGHHRDRIRMDIAPHGTLEISNMDTFGADPIKNAANQEFIRTLMWKLQYHADNDNLQEICEKYPSLFSYPVSEESLRNAHLSNIEVAKAGVEAEIKGSDGNIYKAGELVVQLLEFVNEPLINEDEAIVYNGLPPNVLIEMTKSALVPSEYEYQTALDENGIVSVRGYYEKGIGTLSHWLKRRSQQLKEQGLRDEDIIKNCLTDLAYSYHVHLQTLEAEDIVKLFE